MVKEQDFGSDIFFLNWEKFNYSATRFCDMAVFPQLMVQAGNLLVFETPP
jgi:hypothetical protein